MPNTRPTDGAPEWATDANFPAGPEPEAGSPTKAAYTTGQATIGYRPDQIPTAQEQNRWMNLVYRWVLWFITLFADDGSYAPGAGQNVILTGTDADAWDTATPYLVDDIVYSRGNRYVCITAGTSSADPADAPGPDHGADIVDGTVHWKWIGVGDGAGRVYHEAEEFITYDVNDILIIDTGTATGGTYNGGWIALPAAGYARLGIKIPAGRRIKRIITPTYGNGAADLTINFVRTFQDDASSTTVNTVAVNNPAAAWNVAAGLITPAGDDGVILRKFAYAMVYIPNAAGLRIGPVTVVYDYPLPPT